MELIFERDKYGMNWLRQDYEYAKVTCRKELSCKVTHMREGELLKTQVEIFNATGYPVFTSLTDIAIAFPLEDRYESSEVCMSARCHTHIFCGEEISYIMALRMGGEAPHLGMVLTEGSLGGYSVERDISKMSNDRGCFLLHPSPMELLPGEKTVIAWIIFPHEGREDFEKKLCQLRPFVKVEASDYVIFPQETCRLSIRPSFPAKSVTVDGQELAGANGVYEYSYSGARHWEELYKDCAGTLAATRWTQGGSDPREKIFSVCVDGIHTTCRILVQEEMETLSAKRCHFIAERQQYHGKNSAMQGAYLVYDNEEEHIYYDWRYDYNAGRERAGMGLCIARYLRTHSDSLLEESLREYTEFVKRELIVPESCQVCNDYRLDDDYKRLYNNPWYAAYFTELYELYGGEDDLKLACGIMREFYRQGGREHYTIELPMLSLCRALQKAGMEAAYQEMKALFTGHADRMAENDVHYPASEVNYEQSIVAPAANILLQAYLLTGEERYLEAGKRQLDILELFNGRQPDYHLYETAVRHWDGYWFGKRKLYGDTYPHYWSALTGNCFAMYYAITGDVSYARKAKASLRSVLPMLLPGGRGSCAYVFPETVNGIPARMYDPYANDQDWALYFMLRMQMELPEVVK